MITYYLHLYINNRKKIELFKKIDELLPWSDKHPKELKLNLK